MTETAVALLRGINVGGKNLLPMRALVEIFAEAGCFDAKTYIQSGNIVFRPPTEKNLKQVASCVRAEIEARFGMQVPVVVRTGAEFYEVLRSNPFLTSACDVAQLHTMFLEDQPATGLVATLDPARSPPDEFVIVGREIYLRLPHGAAKTKLTNAYFDAKLKTVCTQRNWRTVQTLTAMAGIG